MYKCTNCNYKGETLSEFPFKDKCPVCGDEVISLGKIKEVKKNEKINLDLNGDGKVDKKDVKIASKVMNAFKKKRKGGKK